jgi:hypothetical protein
MIVAGINDGGWVLAGEYTFLDNAKDALKELVRHAESREPRYLAIIGCIALITNVAMVSNKYKSYSIYIQVGGGL